MSPILAFAATLLALIFSAPVLCAPAARTPAAIDGATAAVPGHREPEDSVDDSPELVPADEGGRQFD